ncbi:hypothetical protein ACFFSH_38580 [Streptomyces filamentosus]|uniref:Uncharacterized protein n=1 Tax=Streptomyces filamentosus TaxID=67294 RepID=A0A919BV60_STRFL|nr:hypothetical protein [Streptomyces filamentosus]GHG15504.1 hypothetical protein GCM10017667_56350 [Streptomyces filamentosus]
MTAQPVQTKARKATRRTLTSISEIKTAAEAELVRWTPEEVIDAKLLPYKSARVLKQKCYSREVFHHNDGGRITFTIDDIRRQNEHMAVVPEKTRRATALAA